MESDPTSILLLLVFASVFLFIALSICAYKLFCQNSDRNEYSSLASDLLGSHLNNVPREFLNDEESLLQLAESFDFTNLSPEEQGAYLKGQEFTTNNPPDFGNVRGKTFTVDDEKLIKECGISAFLFDVDHDVLDQRFIVADKTELNFHNNDMPYSTATAVLNYPFPVKNRVYSDTVYFETKVFEFNNENNPNAHFSIGLVTKPYPSSFRLPGYNKFSIGYESTGNLKINKPFPTPLQQHQDEHSEYNALVLPPLQQSDIVGFGYVISTGTIFITRNGRKVLDVMKGCFVDLFPAVGCFSTNAKFQVNLGQLGFVWIEANVRKYGFVSTSDYKKLAGDRGLASLPQYDRVVEDGVDKVLDKGEELPPRYPEEELDFFGRAANDTVRIGSSAKHTKLTEKNELGDFEVGNEVKEPVEGSSTQVTDEPEEVMDLRERIYEQNIQNETSTIDEATPLINLSQEDSSTGDYHSMDKVKSAELKPEDKSTAKNTIIEEEEPQVETQEAVAVEEPSNNSQEPNLTKDKTLPPLPQEEQPQQEELESSVEPQPQQNESTEPSTSPEPTTGPNAEEGSQELVPPGSSSTTASQKPAPKKKGKKKSGKKGGKKKGKKK
ncbi:Protein SSH4 [Candida viswanathii]|uniref:Protein SSH4 n=1 Tax=Candida viswanathii TaxID=5486 RepID=A0A367YKG8_9ASCO|nr:Protein SSH4 [Candida viswanathii]